MDLELAVHDLGDDHVVLELHEGLTAPGPALELHIVVDSETGVSSAWWEDHRGQRLGAAIVGRA
jgi:hypothetical protein